jgi:hypothetical protein
VGAGIIAEIAVEDELGHREHFLGGLGCREVFGKGVDQDEAEQGQEDLHCRLLIKYERIDLCGKHKLSEKVNKTNAAYLPIGSIYEVDLISHSKSSDCKCE